MKEKAEMTREELIASQWVKKQLDKINQNKMNTETQLTAVEWLMTKLQSFGVTKEEHYELLCQLELVAKEMEKEQMIDFACQVAESSAMKYIQGKTTRMIAEELLTA